MIYDKGFWITIYYCVGLLFAFACSSSPHFLDAFLSTYRSRTGRSPGWFVCALAVGAFIAFWPVWLTYGAVALMLTGRR